MREILEALFLGRGRKAFRAEDSPALRQLDQERDAQHEALMLSVSDMTTSTYRELFPTFAHHHEQARARQGL